MNAYNYWTFKILISGKLKINFYIWKGLNVPVNDTNEDNYFCNSKF